MVNYNNNNDNVHNWDEKFKYNNDNDDDSLDDLLSDDDILNNQNKKNDLDIDMDYVPAQEHVKQAERNNRTMKEQIWATYCQLPYKQLPKKALSMLGMESIKKLNFFPPKGGVSKNFSPRTILHQENIDYNKHCKIPFGSYVQVYNENKQQNTQHPRTINWLYSIHQWSIDRSSIIGPTYRYINHKRRKYPHTPNHAEYNQHSWRVDRMG